MELFKKSVVKTVIEREVQTRDYGFFNIVRTRERPRGKPWNSSLVKINCSIKDYSPVVAGPLFEEQIKYWNPFYGAPKPDDLQYLLPEHIISPSLKKDGIDIILLRDLSEKSLENLDPSQIYFFKHYDYTVLDSNGQRVPLVIKLDYGGSPFRSSFTGSTEKLEEMHGYLSKHPYVVGISPIKEIPYYNNDRSDETFFTILVRPPLKVFNEVFRALSANVISFESDFLRCNHIECRGKETVSKYSMDWLGLLQFYGGKLE